MSWLLHIADKMDECEESYQKCPNPSNTLPTAGLFNLLFLSSLFEKEEQNDGGLAQFQPAKLVTRMNRELVFLKFSFVICIFFFSSSYQQNGNKIASMADVIS